MRRFVYASASLWDIGTPGRPPHAEKEVRARFADYCGNFARQLANACHKTGATCALGLMPDIPSIGAYAHFAKVQRDLCAPTSCDLQQRLSIVDIHTLTANLQHERTGAHFSHVASILEYHAIFDAWLSFLSRLADDTTLQPAPRSNPPSSSASMTLASSAHFDIATTTCTRRIGLLALVLLLP